MKRIPCIQCGKKTQAIHPILDVSACRECQMSTEAFKLVTKTRAKKEFGLTDQTLDQLRHVEKDNPHYKCAAPMLLYLLFDVRAMGALGDIPRPIPEATELPPVVDRRLGGGNAAG